jgi:hypothetical protein
MRRGTAPNFVRNDGCRVSLAPVLQRILRAYGGWRLPQLCRKERYEFRMPVSFARVSWSGVQCQKSIRCDYSAPERIWRRVVTHHLEITVQDNSTSFWDTTTSNIYGVFTGLYNAH